MRLSGRAFLVFGALVGLVIVAATNQIVPASSAHQAQLRVWLAARASGIATYLLLTFQVLVGLVLSHPTNQTTWKLSKRLFPWHEDLLVFVIAFVAVHVVSLVADPYAGVGVGGALVPGLSSYRSSPVALGTLALYALLVTGLTARYAKRLPSGAWLKLHRLSLVVFVLAWLHGMLAGSDSTDLIGLYAVSGLLVVMAAAYRYWIVKRARQRPGHVAAPRADAPATSSGGAPARRLVGAPASGFVGEPVGRLVGEPVGRLVGEPVGRLVGEPAARFVGEPAAGLVARPAGGVALGRPVPAVGAGPSPERLRRPIPNEEVA